MYLLVSMTHALILNYSPLRTRGYQLLCFTAHGISLAPSGKLPYLDSSVDKGRILGFHIGFKEVFNI